MSRPSSDHILPLATTIFENTAKFDKWLSSQGIAAPSFDNGLPEELNLPPEIAAAHEAIIQDTTELQALVLGPLGYVRQHMREVSTTKPIVIRYHDCLTDDSTTVFLLSKASILST